MRGNRIVMLALGAALALVATEAIAMPVVDATKPAGAEMLSPPIVGREVQEAVKPVLPVDQRMRQLYERPAEVPQARVSKRGVLGEMRPRWMNFLSPPLVPHPG